MSRLRSGFTLIEVLVVISIIALLSGLVLIGVQTLRFNARALATTQRMEQVLAGLTRLGNDEGGAVYVLQRDAGLAGTARFEFTAAPVYARPVGNKPWHATWPDPAASAPNPVILPYPWGKRRAWAVREAWYAGPNGLTTADPLTWTAAQRTAWEQPEAHTLHELHAGRSLDLLRRGGILPADDPATATDEAADAWRGDRALGRGWNDAWGNPLVVAWMLFQPPRCGISGSDSTPPFRDFYVQEATRSYQHSRAAYLAVAAGGPQLAESLPTPTGDWVAAGQAIWRQACRVCMQDPAEPVDPARTWTETGFDTPPWQGIKRGNRFGLRSFLTAPAEVK